MSGDGQKRIYLLRQLGLAITSSLGLFAVGLIRGFSSPGIPSMKELSPHLVSNTQHESWIISVPPLGATLGSVVAWPLLQWLGRKAVLQILGPLFTIIWIGLSVADSVPTLIFFRFATGFCAGIAMPAGQVYVSEATDSRIRGLMASLPSVAMALGVLAQYAVGSNVEWRTMAWLSALAPAALAPGLIPFPDSPAWLRLQGRTNAEDARKWYGLEELEQDNLLGSKKRENWFKALGHRSVAEPFLLALAMLVFQQACGNDVVMFNAVMIFEAAGASRKASTAGICLGLFHFVFVLLSIFVVDRWGRRKLLIWSAFFMGLSMAVLSGHFWLSPKDNSTAGLVPLVAMFGYIAAFSAGFCTVPLVLVGEIIPLAQRSALGPAATATGLLCMFIELKTYQDLVSAFDIKGAFAVYAVLNFIAIIVIYRYLPETKGKSLEEIEEHFRMKESTKISEETKIEEELS